jgi:hypothetical protein
MLDTGHEERNTEQRIPGRRDLSVEGGIRGYQQRLVCPKCGKVFFAWRPDELPGQKVKCYFCRHEFADEAAMRPSPTPHPSAAPPTPEKPSPAPTPEKPSPEPTPEKPSLEPTPEKPSLEPTPEKPSLEPTPDRPSSEPTS